MLQVFCLFKVSLASFFLLTTILFITLTGSHDLIVGGTYHLNIEIPASYPFNPPKVGVAQSFCRLLHTL